MSTNLQNIRGEAWSKFMKVSSVVTRALDREMEQEEGLPLSWFEVLALLQRAPEGRVRMQTLAESTVYSRSGVTRLLDRMEEAGLVERQPCSQDRRGWYATITEKGKDMVDRVRPGHRQRIEKHFVRYLDEADMAELCRIFGRILDAEADTIELAVKPT